MRWFFPFVFGFVVGILSTNIFMRVIDFLMQGH